MKKVFITFCVMLTFYSISAQEEDLNGRQTTSFVLKEATYQLQLVNEQNGEPVVGNYSAKRGYIFRIVDSDVDNYVIQFIDFKKNKKDSTIQNIAESKIGIQMEKSVNTFHFSDSLFKIFQTNILLDSTHLNALIETYTANSKTNYKAVPVCSNNNGDFFKIKKSLLDSIKTPYIYYPKWTFTFGTVLIPVKFRFKVKNEPNSTFNFKTDIELGLFLGAKVKPFKNNNISFSFLVGSGPTLAATDSLTTKGYVKDNSVSGAYSITGGFVVEYKKAQLGIFCGADYASGELSKQWIYHNKPWLAIGLGFNIFSVGNNGNTNQKQ